MTTQDGAWRREGLCLVQELVDARRYAEGRGIRLVVDSRRVLEQAKVLIDITRTT